MEKESNTQRQERKVYSGRYVTVTSTQQVATLVLSHPDKPNPLTSDLQLEVKEALGKVGADNTIKTLILTAMGPAFCVGADFGEMLKIERDGGSIPDWTAEMLGQHTNPIVMALRELPIPVICAVQGAAAGAGAGLALAGDLLLMAEPAYIYLPFVPKLGLIPDMGSSWFLLRQLGRSRTMALSLLGNRLSAKDAADLGLAVECVKEESLLERAMHYAARLAKLPSGVVLEVRKALDEAETNSLSDQLDYEQATQLALLRRGHFREGLAAFLEKREPRFS